MKAIACLVLGFVILTHADGKVDQRKPPQCRNPKGKLGQGKKLGCSDVICLKSGSARAKWDKCPTPATEISLNAAKADIVRQMTQLDSSINDSKTGILGQIKSASENSIAEISLAKNATLQELNATRKEILKEIKQENEDTLAQLKETLKLVKSSKEDILGRLVPILEGIKNATNKAGDVFFLPNEFKHTVDNLLTTLPVLSKQYTVSCEFWIDSDPSDVYLIHLTSLDGNTRENGGSIPLVWLYSISFWQTFSWVNGRIYSTSHGALSLKKWYKVEVSQTLRDGRYYYQVRLDGTLLEKEENTTPIDFYNVKVYSGSLYNSNPLDGKIRNVRISNIN